jgi:DUF971 family protein
MEGDAKLMTTPAVLVRKITQKDNHRFTIEWSDGKICDYMLSDLQRQCPCAKCTDEFSGQRLLDPGSVKDDVRAAHIKSVGRYALKIQFTSGCTTGIYSFDMLRKSGN